MEIKGAIFDMDGTLVDSLWFWEMYWEKLGKTFYFPRQRMCIIDTLSPRVCYVFENLSPLKFLDFNGERRLC